MALIRLFLCFNFVFICFLTQLLALLCRLSPFFGVIYIQNRPRWRLASWSMRFGRGFHVHLPGGFALCSGSWCFATRRSPEPVLVRPPNTPTKGGLENRFCGFRGLIILSTNINMKKKLKTGRFLFLSASSVFWTIAILERIWLSMPDNQLLKRLHIFSLHDHYTQKLNFNFIVFRPFYPGYGCGASKLLGW